LSFVTIPSQTYGNAPFSVSATSTSSAPFTYAVVSGLATISGSTVTLTGAGWVQLTVSQPAAGSYTAGSAVINFDVAARTPSLSFAPIAPQSFGGVPFSVSAVSVSTGVVTYAVVSGPATVSGATVTLTGIGTVVLSAAQQASGNYAATTATTSFNVTSGPAALSFAAIAAQAYGNAPFSVSATSASTGAVTYSVVSGPATVSGSTVTLTGAGTVTLGATQAAAGNYTVGTAVTSFTVAVATPFLSFAPIAPQIFGNGPLTLSATSSSSGPVTYSVVGGPASVSGSTLTATGAGTVLLKATQAASGNYAATTATASFSVAPAVPTLSLVAIPTQVFGNTAYAKVVSNSQGSVTYSVVSGPATISSNAITFTGIGTVVISATQTALSNYAAGTATTSFTVTARAPVLSFVTIPSQTYGNAPFSVSATSTSSAPFTYAVVSGLATIGAGWVQLTVSQPAAGSYTAGSAVINFDVAAQMP